MHIRLWLLVVVLHAAVLPVSAETTGDVKLYSALGEPLLLEMVVDEKMLREFKDELFSVEVTERPETVVKVILLTSDGRVLLLTDEPVHEPILNLSLKIGKRPRDLMLFLDPVAPHSRTDFLQEQFAGYHQLQLQNRRLVEQLEGVRMEQAAVMSRSVVPEWEVLTRWGMPLLLGLLSTFLLWRWWYSAERLQLRDVSRLEVHVPPPGNGVERVEWNGFLDEVQQIEGEIRPATGSRS